MAEASITINDIVFVVDCGKAKETTYDALNNTPCLLPSWISQASARQPKFVFLIRVVGVFLIVMLKLEVFSCIKETVFICMSQCRDHEAA
ncbi:RNA helicase [Sarracenia purpurea var. burkii]